MTVGPQNVNLEWDETGVVPPVVLPDTDFLFRRMTEATIEAADARAGSLVLDVGCGWALDAISLTKSGCSVVGIEASTVMIGKARQWVEGSRADVQLVQATAEHLPFRASAFDRVVCKGALDHFLDPLVSVGEMARVLKRDGKAIVAVANFGSLGCQIGKGLYTLRRRLGRTITVERQSWQIPLDHTIKFDLRVLRQLLSQHLTIERVYGVSLLWGTPWWGQTLSRLPHAGRRAALGALDNLGRMLPTRSDVLISRCRPK